MTVYVVIEWFARGIDVFGIYKTEEEAQQHLKEHLETWPKKHKNDFEIQACLFHGIKD